MKTLKIKIQIVLAALGMLTALSMCGSGETMESGMGFQAMILVLLSGAVLLNLKSGSKDN